MEDAAYTCDKGNKAHSMVELQENFIVQVDMVGAQLGRRQVARKLKNPIVNICYLPCVDIGEFLSNSGFLLLLSFYSVTGNIMAILLSPLRIYTFCLMMKPLSLFFCVAIFSVSLVFSFLTYLQNPWSKPKIANIHQEPDTFIYFILLHLSLPLSLYVYITLYIVII